MQSRTLSYIFSVLVLASTCCFAQEETAKSDSTRNEFKPTGVRVGADAIALGRTFAGSDFKGWEVNADIDFRNYYPVIEIGQGQRNFSLTNGEYTNSGNYWRLGADINLLKKDAAKNMFFFGFRFGHSRYNERLTYTLTTDQFVDLKLTMRNSNLDANWGELTTGLKVKVLKSFWMGFTGRLKFFPGYKKDQQFQTYDIPGYGLTFKKQWWGFNYYLMYRIPLVKQH